ncbi:glucarate dehydratase [Kocuria koreensis]|jgi:glucarate dehydratase|uniref:glucarate dehydratase n=1 Tax=Rothia koreensis TaxID=592378 RepID=A0A7K1LJQ0_9MICC|nr:glucarate dehydratase family protein [Rothia koreensis]MUN55427.1 glucarate dehydratase [Rothia koreensis]
MTDTTTIADIRITPVAFADPPLLNSVGVHEPYALRSVVEVETSGGVVGLGESYGSSIHVSRLKMAAESLRGLDVQNPYALRQAVARALTDDRTSGGDGMAGMVTASSTLDRVYSPFEVAALDIQGQQYGVPVSTLLGGLARDEVSFTGYLFYKWAGHPGAEPDRWGEALDAAGILAQAETMVEEYGFTALKLKGGVLAPEAEAEAVGALADRFPGMPIRLDPNAVWSVETAVRVGRRLEGKLEYLEDPSPGLDGMADVRQRVPMPLATNMAVVAFDQLPESVRRGSVDVILSDPHFWGGLGQTKLLAGVAQTFGMGLSMHSNSHLGISMAAMLHAAGATPNIDYACDTHWPWKDPEDDVVAGSPFSFDAGAVAVPTSPGLGVSLDRDKLRRLHEQYLASGMTERDDTGYMRRFDPAFDPSLGRW